MRTMRKSMSMSRSLPQSRTVSRLPSPEKKEKRDHFIEPYTDAGVIHPTTDLTDDRKLVSRTSAHNISRITIHLHDSRVWGLQVYYRIPGRASEVTNGPSIGIKAPMETKSIDFVLEEDEYLTEIYGACNQAISELGFRTSKSKYTTFGCPDLDARLFKLKAPPAHHFKVLIAGSGENLHYIGAEIRPIEPMQQYLDAPKKVEPECHSKFMRASCNLSQMTRSESRLSAQLKIMTNSVVKIPSVAASKLTSGENPYFKGKMHPTTIRENESKLLALSMKSKISRLKVGFNNTLVTALQFSQHSDRDETDIISQGVASSQLNMASTEEIFELKSDEYLIEISGTITDHLLSFGFVTSKGRKEGPFGSAEGTPFKMRAPKGFHFYVVIIGAGEHLHNIEAKVALIPVEHLTASKLQILPLPILPTIVESPLAPPTVEETPIKAETNEFALPKPLSELLFNPPAPICPSQPTVLSQQPTTCPSNSVNSMTKSNNISIKYACDICKVEEKSYMCKHMNFREKCMEDRM